MAAGSKAEDALADSVTVGRVVLGFVCSLCPCFEHLLTNLADEDIPFDHGHSRSFRTSTWSLGGPATFGGAGAQAGPGTSRRGGSSGLDDRWFGGR